MSRVFWLELVVIVQAVLIIVLFVRLGRIESLVGGMLTGWKGKKRGG